MSTVAEEVPESPDYFEPPKPPAGIKKINKRLLAVGGVLVVLAVIPIAYTYHDRFNPDYGNGKGEDEVVVVHETVSPIQRPAPETRGAMPPMPMMDVSGAPMLQGPTEEERRLLEQKRTAYAAALTAPSTVQVSATSRNKPAQQSQPPMYGAVPGAGLVPVPQLDQDGNATDQNKTEEKRQFMRSSEEYSPYLKYTREAPRSMFEVKAGFIIPGVMVTGINSQLPGQIIGQVRENVYDSTTGRYILIPAGSKIIGLYDSDISTGQTHLLVAWNRVVLPDGSSINLDKMPGADQGGIAGMKDKVDNHYWRIFGQAALLSLFSAGIQLSQPTTGVNGTYSSTQIMAAAIGVQMAQLGSALIRRNLNIQPTLTIRPGFQFSVMVNKDIILPPWTGHPMQARN